MFELITLGLFLVGLGICIIGQFEILYALIFGLFCFNFYSYRQGHSLDKIFQMMLEGVTKIKTILIIFVLIGLLTACWRASGTIPYIIYHGIDFIQPQIFALCTFLFCCIISFILGTSFGTVSTIGVICMLLSNSAGLDPLLTGGAILSGIFFGDRGSPMSSSAQLVGAITQTDVYNNAKLMMKTGAIPFVLTCMLYIFFSFSTSPNAIDTSSLNILKDSFNLHWITIIPAIVILTLTALRINVRIAMLASIILCCFIALTYQNMTLENLFNCLIYGFEAPNNPDLAKLLNGGGIMSMLRVIIIVTISSSYSGVFFHTKLLGNVKIFIKKMARLLQPFGAIIVTSIFANAIACNQTLATILTEQLCNEIYKEKTQRALALENSVILIAALIPWNIAVSVPLATINASAETLLYAFFLYMVPLWNLAVAFFNKPPKLRLVK